MRGKKKKMVSFAVKFFVIYAALYSVILATDTFFLEEGLAQALHSFTGLGRLEANTIYFDGEGFEVNESCTGLVSASILAALVFALPRPKPWKKISITVSGAVIMFSVNFFRVAGVLAIGYRYGSIEAEAMHVASWFVTSAVLLVVWYYLNKKISKVKGLGELVE